MQLKKILYDDLNAKQKEIFNFQKLAARLADYGFNCIKLADDWQGADFLAYHKDGKETLKIQLKPRIGIDQKYVGKSLFLAFPINDDWYLIEHDKLIALVGKNTNWLRTASWKKKGGYSAGGPNSKLLKALHSSRL